LGSVAAPPVSPSSAVGLVLPDERYRERARRHVSVGQVYCHRLGKSVEDEIADRMESAVRLRAEADDLENAIAERADLVIDNFLHAGN
jgi:hypothetical protein